MALQDPMEIQEHQVNQDIQAQMVLMVCQEMLV